MALRAKVDGGACEIVFRRRLDAAARGLAYEGWTSGDLENWSNEGCEEAGTVAIDAFTEELTILLTSWSGTKGSRQFARLLIQLAD